MTTQIKSQLLELYQFARQRIIKSIDLRDCPHAGFYNRVDDTCTFCDQELECQWMNHNDELVSIEKKSVEQLKQQLLIAVDYVDSNLTPYHLSRRNCECENCVWLRKAQQVLEKIS